MTPATLQFRQDAQLSQHNKTHNIKGAHLLFDMDRYTQLLFSYLFDSVYLIHRITMKNSSNDNDNRQNERSTLTPPPVPPPTPPPTKNPSSLLSPWWSAEPLPERKRPNDTRRSLIRFTRIVQGGAHSSSEPLFTERCYMLTKTKRQRSSTDSNYNDIPFDQDVDCRMVCLLKDHRKQQQHKTAISHQQGRSNPSSWNPFQGLWLVVATTRARCLEHSSGMCV